MQTILVSFAAPIPCKYHITFYYHSPFFLPFFYISMGASYFTEYQLFNVSYEDGFSRICVLLRFFISVMQKPKWVCYFSCRCLEHGKIFGCRTFMQIISLLLSGYVWFLSVFRLDISFIIDKARKEYEFRSYFCCGQVLDDANDDFFMGDWFLRSCNDLLLGTWLKFS